VRKGKRKLYLQSENRRVIPGRKEEPTTTIRQRQGMGRLTDLPRKLFIVFVLLLGLIGIACQFGHAADSKAVPKKIEPQKPEVAPSKPEAPPKFNVADFVYSSEGRRDPFQSLPLARLRDNKPKKATKRGYELEELKIVGLLKTDKSRYVMMEDVQGKGITFQKGDYLNSNLWVVDVLDGNVVFGYKLKEETKKFTVDVPRK
jgi:Tfp pilus assembly protein PilP